MSANTEHVDATAATVTPEDVAIEAAANESPSASAPSEATEPSQHSAAVDETAQPAATPEDQAVEPDQSEAGSDSVTSEDPAPAAAAAPEEVVAEPSAETPSDEQIPAAGDGEAAAAPVPTPASVARTKPTSADPAVLAASAAAIAAAAAFGRHDDDGNIFVTLPDGNEHYVGQWTTGDASEGMKFYAERYLDYVSDVDLAGRRLADGKMSPDDAERTVERIRAALLDPKIVGDLHALAERIRQLELFAQVRRETLAEEAAARKQQAIAAREEIAAEAEKLAHSTAWRKTSDRYRALVEEWKKIPRVDREVEQKLWERIKTARAEFDKARRLHNQEVEKAHAAARQRKEKLVEQAVALSTSTDFGPTAAAYRDLMDQWKAAGFAGKPTDDQLWEKFRAAQDVFFAARKAANSARSTEWAENTAKKQAIIAQAQELLPVTDLKQARRKFRELMGQYSSIGHVARADKPKLDAAMARVEEAIRKSEHDQWRRSDPEKSARAQAIVALYEQSVAKIRVQLEQSAAAGKDTSKLEAELAAQQELLDAARKHAYSS